MRDLLCRNGGKRVCGDPTCDLCTAGDTPFDDRLGKMAPCTAKDVVYTASCSLCDAWYTGETGRRLGKRVAEHRAAVRNKAVETSALAEHNEEVHGGATNQFKFRVLRRAGGFVMRKAFEALHVQEHDPVLNRHCPFRGVVTT